MKKGHKEVFQEYKGVEGGVYQGEPDDFGIKPGSIHTTDLEKAEKKDLFRDTTGEVLSSVWLTRALEMETNL